MTLLFATNVTHSSFDCCRLGVAVCLMSDIGIHCLTYIRLVSSVGYRYFRRRRNSGKESVKIFSCRIEGDDYITGKKPRGNVVIIIVLRWWKLLDEFEKLLSRFSVRSSIIILADALLPSKFTSKGRLDDYNIIHTLTLKHFVHGQKCVSL